MKSPAFAAIRETVIVFRKEITELLRDYRTVLASFCVPLVLFPLLAAILAYGGQSGGIGTPTDITVSVAGPETDGIAGFLRSRDTLRVVEIPASRTVQEAVSDGGIDVAVVPEGSSHVSVVFDNTNHRSLAGGELVTDLLKEYLVYTESAARVSIPISVHLEPIHPLATGAGTLVLSFLLPVIILVSAAIGSLASAADLGAGEKERRTLESLLGSPARRSAILAGKFAAVVTMGVLGIFSFVAGGGLAYIATRSVTQGIEFTLVSSTMILIVYAAGLAAMTFSAIELLISVSARSSKAAQTLFVPVLIIASATGYAASVIDMRSLSLWYYHVPLLNIGLIVKGAVLDRSHPAGILIVSLWVVVYVLGAFSVGKRIINHETVFRSV